MTAMQLISIWGLVAIGSAVAGGILAAVKNRDHSWWAAWCFVLPPMVIAIALMSTAKGPRPRRPSLDDDDRERELI